MITGIDHHRRSLRLREYDYSQAGAYFVTICTWDRECRFGDVVDGVMRLNDAGEIVRDEWSRTADIRKEVTSGEFVVMPNHIHGIIFIADVVRPGECMSMEYIFEPVGAHGVRPVAVRPDQVRPDEVVTGSANESMRRTLAGYPPSGRNAVSGRTTSGRTPCAPTMNRTPKSLGALIAGYKSAVTKRINIIRDNPGGSVWQRNYYEHVIRDEADYQRIAEYIENNPARWAEDSLHPGHPSELLIRFSRLARYHHHFFMHYR